MKAATVSIIGVLMVLMLAAAACGGDEASPTPRPRATAGPTIAGQNGATQAPTADGGPTDAMIAFDNGAGPVVELTIACAGDALEFDGASFTVAAGNRVELTLDNNSALNQHNWVLVNDGTKDDVSQRGSSYPDNGWLDPGDPDVIAFTPLLDTETVGSVGFVAPSAGTYQFVCTFPAHNVTMFGAFEVTG